MSTNVGKKNIAHKGSGHGVAAPAAMSLVSPPAPPAPTPFPYTARSGNAKKTAGKLKVGGKKVLVEGSTMKLDPPANQPARTCGGDVVTHATKNIAVMTTGSMSQTVGGKGVCATGDIAALNVLVEQAKVAQMQLPLLEAGDFDAASKSNASAAAMNKKYKRAFPPSKASQCPGGHPVDLGTGYVVDDAIDLQLPGLIPLVWSRSYSSSSSSHGGSLGKGGWTHSFEQWVEVTELGFRFHDEEGLPVELGPIGEGGFSFHRGKRIELRQIGHIIEVRSLVDRRIRTFSPLPSGRLTLRSIRDARGHQIQLEYEGFFLHKVIDSVGRELRLTNDAKGRVTRVEVWASDPGSGRPPALQTWFDYGYHPEGELASHTNSLGHAERWEYDGLHRMIKATLRNGVSFYYEYHPELGYCNRTWGDGGLHDVRIELDFDKGETCTHGTNRARRYLWKNGIVHREETFEQDWATERIYDEDELLVAVRNGAGEATIYERDARGNLIRETDPAGNVSTWRFEDDLPTHYVDPRGLTTRYIRDHVGSLIGIAFPTGVTYHFDLDQDGRLRAIYDNGGLRVRFELDEHSNVRAETTGRGALTMFRHDALGRAVERTDALHRKTQVHYDRQGQVLEIARPDGTRARATYDPLGMIASATDALGRVTRIEHAGTGQIARVTQPDGQIFRFLYDSDERLIRILNPRLEQYEFHYDRADQIVGEQTFDGRLLSYRYNRAGRIVRVDLPESEWREISHDKLGNVIEDRGSDVQIAFARDALGRIEKAVCQDVTGKVVTELQRDPFGRLTADIQNGRAVRYEYDERGRLSTRVLPNRERTEYHFDEDETFAGVTHGGKRLSVERDLLGRERRRRMAEWSIDLDYDALDRLLMQKVSWTGEGSPRALTERRYGYDILGRLTSIQSSREGTVVYEYDAADRLLQASRGGLHEVFEYDPAGSLVNRLSEFTAGRNKGLWSLAPGNRLLATDSARFVNDDRGRRIQRIERTDQGDPRESPPTGDEQVTTYGWDTKDRLREVTRPDGTRVRFTYDAFGRRVRKDILGSADVGALLAGAAKPIERRTVSFLWDGFVLCEEIDSAKPEADRRRIHVHQPGTFVPILQIEAGQTFGVVTDHLGMPKELIDGSGRVAWRAEHGAWGDVVRVTRDEGAACVESPFRHLGQYADEETGLHHTVFRYFEPATARWLSPDPLGVLGGTNLSGFNASPTFGVDPLGLVTCAERMQELANQAYQKLINDPDAVRARLTKRERRAAEKKPWLKRVFFGTAMERELDEMVKKDPLTSKYGIRGLSGSGPDYESKGGKTFELTTDNPRTIAKHQRRSNVADHIITYPSLSDDQVFGNKGTGVDSVF